MTFVGVDPGLNGGIASVDVDGDLLYAVRMPTGKFKSGRRFVSVPKLRKYARTPEIDSVAIEWVWALPGESPSASFSFGAAYGQVSGAFEVLHVVALVTPQKWKKSYGLPGGDEGKDQARELATEMWPAAADWFKYKIDAGPAEAALIAEYQRMNR